MTTTLAPPTLRDYQDEAGQAVVTALQRGVRRQLLVLATGLGKSVIAASLPRVTGLLPALSIVNRIELIKQNAAHFERVGHTVSIEQAARQGDPMAEVVCASVDTLGRADGKRRAKWHPMHFRLVVSDEAHFDMVPSRLRVLRHFQPELLIGLTATPWRSDKQCLSNVYDDWTFERTADWGIDHGWLCRARAQRIYTDVDLSNVKQNATDFDERELGAVINTDFRSSLICSGIEQHAEGRRAILIFCTNQAHTEQVTRCLQARGHQADFVLDYLPASVRDDKIAAFKAGELRILVNCNILSFGFDAPITDCLVMATPTKSLLRYVQWLGRGMRPYPEKLDLLVLDVVDICGRHPQVTASDVFGVRDVDALGTDVLLACRLAKKAAELGLSPEGESVTEIAQQMALMERVGGGTVVIETQSEAVALFDATALAPEVERDSLFGWVKLSDQRYVLQLRDGICLLSVNPLGEWTVQHESAGENLGAHPRGVPFRLADRFVKRVAEDWRMRQLGAKWHAYPVTDAQLGTLERLGVRREAIPDTANRGWASHMINVFTLTRKLRRLERLHVPRALARPPTINA